MRRNEFWRIILTLVVCWTSASTAATPGRERGATSQVRIEGFDPLIPTLRKWYVPQDLYYIYNWGGYKYTNYAKDHFARYVSTELEGRGRYDIFGNWVTRGWELYDWREEHPLAFGSSVFKDSRYGSWFQNLVVAADSKGQYFTALTIGDAIRTTLTPLTFSRSNFNGMQWDFMSDKYQVTVLRSRVSEPVRLAGFSDTDQRSDFTNLIGLRTTAQIGDFINLGFAFVNTHFGASTSNFSENSLAGLLTSSQNSGNVDEITIRITDDSPGDGSGAFFFSSIMSVDGEPTGIEPTIEGGRRREGFLEALAEAPILLRFRVPDPLLTKKVHFDLVLSNDYKVEATSNLQTNLEGQTIFLPVARSSGNARDNSNQQIVSFDYGLPSANQVASFTLETQDLMGFEIRGEYAQNTQFQRYPNINVAKLSNLEKNDRKADAWYLNVTKRYWRFFGYGEVFSMDHNYTTRGFVPAVNNDFVDYENTRQNWFEYIDDNDDQDRVVDWARVGSSGDRAIFPGLDENNDLVSDFNENGNRLPDYEEPFLRHYVDPPEFLFGVDMNNNTVIDRFENDEEADYPYKKGHRGYNFYAGGEIYPGISLSVGRSRERLLAGEERSEMWYALLSGLKDYPRLGRLEVFSMLKSVKDDIPDNLVQWVQRPGSFAGLQPFDDPRITDDTTVLETAVGYTYYRQNLTFKNKLRWNYFRQRGQAGRLLDNSSFLGLINKADYPFKLTSKITVIPRWKSMWRRRTQPRPAQLELNELTEILSLSAVFPLLNRSRLEIGFETIFFFNAEPIDRLSPSYVDDFVGKGFTVQYTNRVQYQGYNLIANIGFQGNDTKFSNLKDLDTSNTIIFVQVFVGIDEERQGGRPAERRGVY